MDNMKDIREVVGKKCRYYGYLGTHEDGIIVHVEPYGSSVYIYIADRDESRNIHKTTLDGTVKEFAYKDVRISDEVEIEE